MDSSNNITSQNDEFTYRERHAHRHDVIERIILVAGTFIISMLAIRFVFALLGANPNNGLDIFVNNFTSPFVAPFYNLFSYDHPTVGVSSFEGYTLVAMGIYGLIVAGLTKLISITRY